MSVAMMNDFSDGYLHSSVRDGFNYAQNKIKTFNPYSTENNEHVDSKRFFYTVSLERMLRHSNNVRNSSALVNKYASSERSSFVSTDYSTLIELMVSGCIEEESCHSVADMVGKIKKVFGLSTASVAAMVGVSRATIYNHISCSSKVDVNEYLNLFYLAKDVEEKGYNVSRGLKSVSVEGKTLLKHLSTPPFEHEKLINICGVISTKLAGMNNIKPANIYDQKLASITNNK
ncbi:hypothetical protein N7936_000315 [Cronobacter sakazakii]|uniref:hypothetical protein n=1 Tax=Cronobacter sakazakii TaxID=28141 RepID=UPI001016DE1F|nr:hypothetical protein [Cronobacter sakazakii]EJV9471545.1 hypothetical protein [Cronobacter sakazakii]MDT3520953.1 hypothetical protein [Cronobacter sakazakii]